MGLFGSAGLKSAASSVSQIVAALVGQDLVAKTLSLTQTTGNIALQLVTGAKAKFGGGTTDFITSDGATTLTTAGDFIVGATLALRNAAANFQVGSVGNARFNVDVGGNVLFDHASVIGSGSTTTGKVTINNFVDDSGTTGNRTVNSIRGISAVAAAGTAITITNGNVTATSTVLAVLQSNDANDTKLKSVVPGAGSFVINLSTAPAATVKVAWFVLN